jgi:nicotinamidase-related amidase
MPVSTLDQKAALIVIDLQKGITQIPVVHPRPLAEVIANAAKLAGAFRRKSLPVVLVNVTGGAPGRAEQSMRSGNLPADFAELVPELNAAPGDHRVSKRTWGAFTGTDLSDYLKKGSVTQVVVVGVATSAGVESTARHAHELGLHVVLATDAMADMSAEAHDNSLTRIFPRIGETGTTDEILQLVDARH